jgi:hypothetical protein
MPDQPFLIAAPHVGLERDLESWLLPNDAYPQLEDAYLWRGRIKKRQGYKILGRLQLTVATVPAGPNVNTITFTVPSFPLTPFQSQFTFGGVVFMDNGSGNFTFTSGGAASTINYATGDVTLNLTGTTPAGSNAIFFPCLPVMGLPNLDQLSNNQSPTPPLLMAFDPKFAYLFNAGTLNFIGATNYKGTSTPVVWTGDDADFFWTTNYANALWATNFKPGFQQNPIATTAGNGDGLRWFDQDTSGWINYCPPINAGATSFLGGALIIVPYKGRLVCFNTWEGANFGGMKNFPQRARWSQIGSPYYDANKPTNFQGGINQTNAWNSDTPGFGGFFDAPTGEAIVSAQFVKDTLIVYFENSTWQFAYTGNELLPFLWVKINTELGALSTFSEVPFDRIVLGMGAVGIHACDSVNVERIDQKIPDEVFSISGANFGRERVYAIRDYYTQLVYWALPYSGIDESGAVDDIRAVLPPPGVDVKYPNRILTYNYIDQSYSFFNDSFTCFGYYLRVNEDVPTWQATTSEWQSTYFTWVSPTSLPAFPFVAAGNQQGFVEIFDPNLVANSESLVISAATGTNPATITSLNHNLFNGMVVGISNNGSAFVFGTVTVLTKDTFTIDFPFGTNFPGTFEGNAVIQVVPAFNVITKRFSPYIEEGIQNRISFIDIYVDRTVNGEFQVLTYQDEDNSLPTNELTVATYPESTYTNSPDTLPYINKKLWKRVYLSNVAQEFQLQFTLSNDELLDPDIASSQIVIHAIILWISKAGRLTNS